jgi:hypothetical protein
MRASLFPSKMLLQVTPSEDPIIKLPANVLYMISLA